MSARRYRTPRRGELSQHFLRSRALASSLVAQASISQQDLVIEIGPGRGILTGELAPRCRELVAIELDERLCQGLRERFRRHAHVSIVHRDFLRVPLPDEPYQVFGNIPFSRTAAIVRKLVDAPSPPDDIHLVVQREAAERFAGGPYAPETLASLALKPRYHVEIIRRLQRADFDPPPSVDCVVVWLARRGRALVAPAQRTAFRGFLRACFGRGVTVAQCLRPRLTRRQVSRLSRDLRFDPLAPPSALSFDQWLGVFRFWALAVFRG